MYTKPPLEELKRKLSPLQYEVTQNDATEPPFRNEFWDNHAPGLYVDVVTGEPLFSSLDKFESGTGWPSFVRPIENGHVALETDTTLGMTRTEVRSSAGGSHLGHVFDDGPAPTGLRYCINSAALRFIPADRLVVEGYGAYAARFGSGASAAPLAAATDNACAAPKPGDQPGCQATLDTALFAGGARTKEALEKVPGVLDIETGTTERTDAVRVIFDPKQVAYADLLNKWAAIEKPEGLKGRIIFVTSNEQQDAAEKWKAHLGDRAAQTGPVIVRKGDSTLFTPSRR